LRHLDLTACDLWNDAQAATELLSALTGHVSISFLDFSFNPAPRLTAEAVGAALGALAAADAPALEELHLESCNLGDAGTGPLVDALAGNMHLRILNLRYNDMSDELATQRLLPAVRANTSLRDLNPVRFDDSEEENEPDAVLEARQLVWAREAARLAAQAGPGAA
jgi:Ran GTPase-activating protein (RanGAP) involved in mRNA processing and transport